MKRYLLSAALGLASVSVMAADAFTGPSVGLGLGYAKNKVDFGGFMEGKSSSESDGVAQLRGSYGFEMSKDWVGTVGLGYQFNKSDFGDSSYVDGGKTYGVNVKLKHDIEVSFAPGYRLTPQSLAYAKLSYHSAKGEYNDAQLGPGKTSHHGVGYGAGYAMALSGKLEANIEFQHIDYSRESANQSTGKPRQDVLIVGLNYRF